MVVTLLVLATAFGLLFLHNWRLFEQSSGVVIKPEGVRRVATQRPFSYEDGDIEKIGAEVEEGGEDEYQELDPMLRRKLLATRRKSVAFSVCVVDRQ